MYNQNYKVEIPQFPDREVSIAEYGAKSGDLQIETGRHNAEAINRAICEVSEQGGGTVRVPAGIWAVAPLRLLSGVNLHLDSQAMLKFIKSKEDYPLRITSYEGQDCIRTVSPVTAENAENILKAYRIVMDVKETGKSYILQLVEFESRYSASHISHLFSKSKRVVLRKAKGGHAIRKWGDGTFTFYPFQAGIPFYFEKLSTDAQGEATPEHGGVDNRDVCESRACAYNRDGICRFSLVHDRPPNITEADDCAEFVSRPYQPEKMR